MKNKHYLIFDNYDYLKELKSYEELRELLIDELERDVEENYDDKAIILDNFKIMKELTKNECKTKYIIEQLNFYGYNVQDLCEIQRGLSNYQAYKHGVGAPSYPNDCIEQTLKMIEEDMK